MTDQERFRIAHHEAGHGAAAFELGRRVDVVSMRPCAGVVNAFIVHEGAGPTPAIEPSVPTFLQPRRHQIEVSMAIFLAGPAAEYLVVPPPTGYVAESLDEIAAKKAAVSLSAQERESLQEARERLSSGEFETDEDSALGESARLGEQASFHYAWIRAEVAAWIESPRMRRLIRELALVLLDPNQLEDDVLPGRRAEQILSRADRRPPVWRAIAADKGRR